MNHASAVSACSQHGSHLVFIESKEEQDFIAGSAKADVWIGLANSSFDEARWLDGTIATYNNLKPSSFNDNGICFQILLEYASSWSDKECSRQFRYVCEKEVGV